MPLCMQVLLSNAGSRLTGHVSLQGDRETRCASLSSDMHGQDTSHKEAAAVYLSRNIQGLPLVSDPRSAVAMTGFCWLLSAIETQ